MATGGSLGLELGLAPLDKLFFFVPAAPLPCWCLFAALSRPFLDVSRHPLAGGSCNALR